MKRRLFTLLAAISLLLCAATVVMWVRSRFLLDALLCTGSFDDAPRVTRVDWHVRSYDGCIQFGRERDYYPNGVVGDHATPSISWKVEARPDPDYTFLGSQLPGRWHRMGFAFDRVEWPLFGGAHSRVSVKIPYWLLVTMFAAPALTHTVSNRLARRRVELGACAACGYDLRATPDRCPECGTVPLTKGTT